MAELEDSRQKLVNLRMRRIWYLGLTAQRLVDILDGAVSVLTDSTLTLNGTLVVNLPIVVAAPPIISTAFVGTQCIIAPFLGTPYVTNTGRSTPVVVSKACTPYVTDSCRTTPNV